MGPANASLARRGVPLLLLAILASALVGLGRGAHLEPADLVINNGAEIATLDPATVSGVPEGRVMRALFEGLTVKDPRTLEPLPGVAEGWEVSDDRRTYTFHLRPEARWNNGDALTAHDFEWSWRRLLDPETAAEYAYLLWSVRGARQYTSLSDEDAREAFWARVGIHAADAHTLVVELASPVPYFLDLTSFYPTFPVHRPTLEAARTSHPDTWQAEWIRPENIVTNGPFQIVERRVNDRIRLEKNPLYWDADEVAKRTIDILAVEHFGTMLNMYLTGGVDWIDKCAPNLIPRLLQREDFRPAPYLGSYFYRFNVHRPPFDDVRVRRALALAVDRLAICEKITKKGETPLWSLCPPGMAGYEPPEMEHAPLLPDLSNRDVAFAEDCRKARTLLAEAGYGPEGAPFPTIQIHYNTAETHRDLAEVVADGWKRNLGIDARLQNQEWKVYLETQKRIDYGVSRSSWIGDYPDPNTFIELFVADGRNNRTGWSDPRYDALVAEAASEPDPARRLRLLARAEAILLDQLPILPLYGYVSQNLVNPRLGGFHANIQDEHSPKFWYWMDDAELAAKRAAYTSDWELVRPGGPPAGLYSPAEGRRRAAR